MNKYFRLFTILVAALYQLVISGCSVEPIAPHQPEASTSEEALQQLYVLARESKRPLAEQYRLQITDLLIDMQRTEEAAEMLANIKTRGLPGKLKALYTLAHTRLALASFEGNRALQLLNKNKSLYAVQSKEIRIRASRLKADAFDLLDRPFDKARQLVSLYPLLTGTSAQETKEAIWNTFATIPEDMLTALLPGTRNQALKGWTELALATKKYQYDLDRQLRALNNWQAAWPNHPAAITPPDELLLLSSIALEQPGHIALMLPLQGKNGAAGRAIRDGFMAAFYAALGDSSRVPVIDIIDTSDTDNILEVYDAAIANGAEFIIGPLDKKNVQLIQSQPELLVPTIALNYGNTETQTGNLYQFGLSAEDEAKQVAHKAWQKGHRNTLVLAPDSNWGQRIAQAFMTEWQTLSGNLLEAQYYSEEKNYSDSIRELLNLDSSDARADRIKALLRSRVHFSPRRRSDMDFIFIVGTPKQARQIKPTLAFHFAGNVPVYATSHIYSGIAEPLLNRDLDGIWFCETPWMLDSRKERLKSVIQSSLPASNKRLGRLYALGIDAYRLFPRVKQLAVLEQSRLYGNTGSLGMKNSRIVRTLDWAYFRNGKARPMP